MTKITILGTGMGTTKKLYNTCFTIHNTEGVFLVDCGGSIEIINRLTKAHVPLEQLKNIFISHTHTDHILGFVWLLKGMANLIMEGKIIEKINVYCNDNVYEAIKGIFAYTVPPVLIEAINNCTNFIIIKENEEYCIHGVTYKFFDLKAKGPKQSGFECMLGKNKLVFLGDEPLNPLLEERVKNAEYVMHEAFCLDSEKEIFKPYEKNHSTALSTAKVMQNLNVKNLILYHTEETHDNKKELYEQEAKQVFSGNVFVPNEMEEFEIIS